MAQAKNPSTILKNFTPKEFLPQPVEAQPVDYQKFFEFNKIPDIPATPSNGFNAYPTRTPQFISSLFNINNSTGE